jgi:hypothetical protein
MMQLNMLLKQYKVHIKFMKYTFLTLLFIIFLGVPAVVSAGVLPPCTATGNCGICDMMFTANAIMRWITMVAGAGALLFFVWGGFLFVTAAGDKGRVKKGRDVIINTIVGLLVIFMAWTAVNFVINKMAGRVDVMTFTEGQQVEWYNLCAGNDGDLNNCEGKGDGYPCGNEMTQYCLNDICQPLTAGNACSWLKKHAGYENYSCQTAGSTNPCGVRTVAECDLASNCIKNLCGLDKENFPKVCCTPK